MSDSMSSAEIENVLSSIRRLVTEDLRPRASAAAAPAAPEPGTAAGSSTGRLLLTPALRVVVPAPAAVPLPAAAAEGERARLDGLLSIIGARVAPPPAGFEAETGDAFPDAAPPLPAVAQEFAAAADPAAAAQDAEDEADEAAAAPVVDLDEDVLRELIRDVLREELQGQMGERITRNIRKLVRAELARAAALRGVD
jgi:hypothetical protein